MSLCLPCITVSTETRPHLRRGAEAQINCLEEQYHNKAGFFIKNPMRARNK